MNWYSDLIYPFVNGENNPLRNVLYELNSNSVEFEILKGIESGRLTSSIYEKSDKWNFYKKELGNIKFKIQTQLKKEIIFNETVTEKRRRFRKLLNDIFLFHDLLIMDFRQCRECISENIYGRPFALNKAILFEIIKINLQIPFSLMNVEKPLKLTP